MKMIELSSRRISNGFTLTLLIGGACLLFPLSGCGPTDATTSGGKTEQAESAGDDHSHDHDHAGHDHSAHSLPESVTELETVFATISKGFADNDAESVHHELHEVGHLLEAIETKVKAGEGVAEGKQEGASQAVASLMEGFMTLDDSLHGNEDADIEGAKTKISDGLTQLKDSLK